MRIVFFGTAPFAVPSLRACNARHQVVAAITQPDRPGSRGRPAPRPVAETAGQLGIPVLQPERVRARGAVEEVLGLGAEALVVAAYGQIIPAALLDGPRFGGVNVHASLLPRWRGAAPVARAILAGDPVTGVSIMRMDQGLDTGPVYARREVAIDPAATTPSLTETLAVAGAEELVAVLAGLERGIATASPQLASSVTQAARLTRQDGRLDWSRHTAVEVDRMVRALDPWPGVTTEIAGGEVRLLSGRPVPEWARNAGRESRAPEPGASEPGASKPVLGTAAGEGPVPGAVVGADRESVLVATTDGAYRVDQVQPPGRRPMTAAAYLRGRRQVPA